jgi:hypothetical protein
MKKVYISFMLHGNMCYDRYTKQEIREKFPFIYVAGIRAMRQFPQVTAHIDFPGLTTLSLKQYAPWLLEELKPLVERKQVVMGGCEYAASLSMCSDEESGLLAARLGMEIMRNELQPDAHVFLPQEVAFHPQSPLIMSQIGASSLIVVTDDWSRPLCVRGVDGSEVAVYPASMRESDPSSLERLYDAHEDDDFVLIGGDFEMLGSVAEYVVKIDELAAKGKIIEWTTVDRYAVEIGNHKRHMALSPFGHSSDDDPASPSFSRWVSDPEDIAWHGQAVQALDALRIAGLAKVAAQAHGLGTVDVPIEQAWTSGPDNAWDHYFEHALEYPEVEARYLSATGQPSLLSRAWHQALIGLNSDASGWVPWTPRTRHRTLALQSARALADEVITRFAGRLAQQITRPSGTLNAFALALNAAPARTAELVLGTEQPMAVTEPDGSLVPTATLLQDGHWTSHARVALPAYGYKLLGLVPTSKIETWQWQAGQAVEFLGRRAVLADGVLTITEGDQAVQVSIAPFVLTDPAGLVPQECVTPDWCHAQTRVRNTSLGSDLEVFTELAWTLWMRLVIGLRHDRVELAVEVYVDMPRTIGRRRFDPEGVILQFRGRPGSAYYDIPYATIRHRSTERSFVAVQRFAAMVAEDASGPSFGVIALGGNQSFLVVGREGIIGAGLGASKQARPAVRPRCVLAPDGTAQHLVTPASDPLHGDYKHRFALVFGSPTEIALAAHKLRTGVPLVRVEPGNGAWPAEQSLFAIEPDTALVTAFRAGPHGIEIAFSDVSGQAGSVSCQGQITELSAYGLATVQL